MGISLRARGRAGLRLTALAGTSIVALGFAVPTGRARPWIPLTAAPPASQSTVGLRVIPFPGTPDAAPQTHVIFPALRPSDLRSLVVIGARSGRHAGRLQMLPARAGTEFVPTRPFTPGEKVEVSATLGSPRAGAAEGDPGATHVSYSFAVGARVSQSVNTGLDRNAGWRSVASIGPSQDFRSARDLHPPAISASADPDSSSGDIFVAPVKSPQVGPMILDPEGRLVWFHPVTATEATNFAVQRYLGHPVLTWWQGSIPAPGEDVIMSPSYRRLAVVHAGDGYQAELHEFQITPRGTAFITCFAPALTNLTSVGGPSVGGVIDGVIQEVDIKTGKVLWEWHALGHIPVDASYTKYDEGQFYDFFHLNSIQQLSSGNLLISARNTWAVYEISRKTGKVLWALGGKHSDFTMGPGTNFEWQHDARLAGHTLSLLDDAADPQEESQSSAKYLSVDTSARTVSLLRRFTHDPPVLTSASGSVQPLPNGNVLVGWGAQPQVSEYTPAGRQIFDLSFAQGVWSYRAFRFPWVGQPRTRPSLAVSPSADGGVKVYASWNGATQVAAWRVLGGSSRGDLKPLGPTTPWNNFETATRVLSEPRYFAVQALNRQGTALRTSPAHADPPHLAVFGSSVFVPASGGLGTVPVGCLSRRPCRVRVTVSARDQVVGRSSEHTVAPYRAALVPVRFERPTSDGVVQVTARAGSELSASRQISLIGYSGASAGSPATLSGSAGTQVARATDFVSASGEAGILSACYASVVCHLDETVSIAGRAVGRATRTLGAGELGYVEVQLDAEARAALSRAAGNRLAANVVLTARGRARTSQIDLVSYS